MTNIGTVGDVTIRDTANKGRDRKLLLALKDEAANTNDCNLEVADTTLSLM